MKFSSDNRGQSLQVGAVLLFGFIVLALTIYQTQGVPAENKQVEFEHSQQVGDEMVGLYNAVFDTVVSGEPQSAAITLGTEYNNRLFFIYPPPASGTLNTTDGRQLRLHNVTAITANQSFDNYWNNATRVYTTRAITYQPNYRELRGAADYRIEYGILAAQYPETTRLRLAETHQPIIDGTEIELVVIDGELQSVDTDVESVIPERVTESTTVTVTNATNTTGITLELPTALGEDHWNTSDSDDLLYGQSNVENVSVNGGIAEIRLANATNYTLTLHKVDVASGATELEATYLWNRSYDGSDLTVEVRDAFNDHIEEPVDVWSFNGSQSIEREITGGEATIPLDSGLTFDPGEPCGVALVDPTVDNPEPYQEINMTGRC